MVEDEAPNGRNTGRDPENEPSVDSSQRSGGVPAEDSGAAVPANLRETARRAEEYIKASRARNTRRAYASDLEDFRVWCKVDGGGLSPLPADPETLALYLTDLAGRGLKVSTIQRRLASIATAHREAVGDSPTDEKLVRSTMAGIRRTHGSAQKQAAPLTVTTLRRVLASIRDHDKKTGKLSPAALRDRALLLIGFAGGFRRNEISELLVEDLTFVEGEGVVAVVRRSKTDAAAEGEAVGIPYGKHAETCPVTNLERWLDFSGRADHAPLFCPVDRHGNVKATAPLSGDGINGVVKKRIKEAGLDPERYSGHSLRAGLPTSASTAGVGMEKWMPHTRHRSVAVAMRYARRGTLFTNNPAAQVGL